MKVNLSMKSTDKIDMNHEFIEILVELYNKLPEEESQFAVQRVAVLVELEMRKLEAIGQQITRESMLDAFKSAIQKHKEFEEIERNAKIA